MVESNNYVSTIGTLFEKEKRGSHVHFTLYYPPNLEPIGFIRVLESESDLTFDALKEFYGRIAKTKSLEAPRVTSG